MQVAAFAHLTGNEPLKRDCRTRFKTILVQQMATDGSFPRELGRTKPYGYSLFNLEAMATICQILSTPEDDLWAFELPDGRGMRRAMAYMVALHPRQDDLAEAAGRDVRRQLADAAGESAVCRRGAEAAGLHRPVVHAAGRLGRRGSHPQFLHPATAALVRLTPPSPAWGLTLVGRGRAHFGA